MDKSRIKSTTIQELSVADKNLALDLYELCNKEMNKYSAPDIEKYELANEFKKAKDLLSEYVLGYIDYSEVQEVVFEVMTVYGTIVDLTPTGVTFFYNDHFIYFPIKAGTKINPGHVPMLNEIFIKQSFTR